MKNVQQINSSWLDQLKAGNVSGAFQSLKQMDVNWGQVAIMFGIGFVTGFLFKRYYKMAIVSVAVGLVLIWGLDHSFHIINWQTVNTLVGSNPAARVDSLLDAASSWIAHNVIFAASLLVGVVLGILV